MRDIVRDVAEVTILGNHDAAVAGRMDYSYYYEAARHALDTHAPMLTRREHGVAEEAAVPDQVRRASASHLCHGSPLRLEEFEYIFAPEQARECLPIWDELGHITLIGHSHLCKVFALTQATRCEELPPTTSSSQPEREVHRQRRLGRPAARLRQPRQLHVLRHATSKRFEFKRVEYDIETAAEKVFGAKLERNFAHRLFIGV